MTDFLMFRGMIVPTIIRFLFWIGLAISGLVGVTYLGVGVVTILGGFASGEVVGGVLGGILIMVVGVALCAIGALTARVYAELVIVVFRIYETQVDILQELRQARASSGASRDRVA